MEPETLIACLGVLAIVLGGATAMFLELAVHNKDKFVAARSESEFWRKGYEELAAEKARGFDRIAGDERDACLRVLRGMSDLLDQMVDGLDEFCDGVEDYEDGDFVTVHMTLCEECQE